MHNLVLLRFFIWGFLLGTGPALMAQSDAFEVRLTGQGPDMIFIPGHSCDGAVWTETVEYYAPHYTCHVLTLAGYAGTEPLPQDSSFLETYRDAIAAYIERLPEGKAILVGHSIGGFLGLKLALDYPERLTGLIVVDALPFLSAVQNPDAKASEVSMDIPSMVAFRKGLSREQYDPYQRRSLASMIRTEARIDTVLEWSWRTDPLTGFQTMYELMKEDLRPRMAEIKTPTLVLGAYGWDGPMAQNFPLERSQAIYKGQYGDHPALSLYICEAARHFIMYDDFDCMTGQMDTFLASQNDR